MLVLPSNTRIYKKINGSWLKQKISLSNIYRVGKDCYIKEDTTDASDFIRLDYLSNKGIADNWLVNTFYNLFYANNKVAFNTREEARQFWGQNIVIKYDSNALRFHGVAIYYELSDGSKILEQFIGSTGSAYYFQDAQWRTVSFTEPVQSDWNQTNDKALDYIKNKPKINNISGVLQSIETRGNHNIIDDPFFETMNLGSGNKGDAYNIGQVRNNQKKYMVMRDNENFLCYLKLYTGAASTAVPTGLFRLTREYLERKGVKEGQSLVFGAYVRISGASLESKRTFYLNGRATDITDTNWHFVYSNINEVTYDTYGTLVLSVDYRYTEVNEELDITGIFVKVVNSIDDVYGFELSESYVKNRFSSNSSNLFIPYKEDNREGYIESLYNNTSIAKGTGTKSLFLVEDIEGFNGYGVRVTPSSVGSITRIHGNIIPTKQITNNIDYIKVGCYVRINANSSFKFNVVIGQNQYSVYNILIDTNIWVPIISPVIKVQCLIDFNDSTISWENITSIDLAYPCIIAYDHDYVPFYFSEPDVNKLKNYLPNIEYFYGKKWCPIGDSVTAADAWVRNINSELGMTVYPRGCGSSALTFSIGKMAVKPNGYTITRRNIHSSDEAFIEAVNQAGYTEQITNPTWLEYSSNPSHYPEVTSNQRAYFLIDTKANNQDRINTIPLDTDIVSIMFYNDFGEYTDEEIGTIDNFEIDPEINKGRGTIIANLRQWIYKVNQRLPNAKVILMVPYYTTNQMSDNIRTANGIGSEKLRNAYRDVAKTYGYPIIDMTKAINYYNNNKLLSDGTHPNNKGLIQMTSVVKDSFLSLKNWIKDTIVE